MKNKLLLIINFFLITSAFSQITFDRGYYIDNAGQKKQVLIKYADWKNNPVEITVKNSEDALAQTLSVKQIAEFGVDNEAIYIRSMVPIDQSSNDLKKLSRHGRFEYKEDQVFLKMLVDGKADLLQYQQGKNEQFFFRNEAGAVEALIYKRYIPEYSIKIAENNQYQQQLFNSLKCTDLEQEAFTATAYEKDDLVKLFSRYNNCENSDFKNFSEKKDRDAFNLRVRPGVNFSSLVMNTYVVRRTMDFGDKTTFRIGLEGEYVFPFNRNKWAIIVEPTYQSYESEAIFPEGQFGDGLVTVNYQSIEIPFGARHYFFLNEQNRLFLNVTYTVDLVVGDSGFDYDTVAVDTYDETKIDTNTGTNFSLGGGYSYNRFSVEARYHLDRTLTGKKTMLGTAYNTFSVILGYNFL